VYTGAAIRGGAWIHEQPDALHTQLAVGVRPGIDDDYAIGFRYTLEPR
jgi:hypothetical protein